MKIGVLAVQGNFREHAGMLRRLGADVVEVRKPEQLEGLDGLVVPGGESNTFMLLMRRYDVEQAIARGSGADSDAAAFETVIYEGYGPNGVAVIVEALTDNRNRTASDVRHVFAKNDGNLGGSGTVTWLFERRGIVLVAADGVDEDELMLAAADAGADDVTLDESSYEVVSAPENLAAVHEALEQGGYTIDNAELTMVPKTTVEVADESDAKKILRLVDQLEESDDVQDVFANFDIPESVLEAVAS